MPKKRIVDSNNARIRQLVRDGATFEDLRAQGFYPSRIRAALSGGPRQVVRCSACGQPVHGVALPAVLGGPRPPEVPPPLEHCYPESPPAPKKVPERPQLRELVPNIADAFSMHEKRRGVASRWRPDHETDWRGDLIRAAQAGDAYARWRCGELYENSAHLAYFKDPEQADPQCQS